MERREEGTRARELSQQQGEQFANQYSSMARDLPPYDQLAEEDYIDMDVSSAAFSCYNITSPTHSREFEFQMSAPLEREAITSPADELFYKGKLLPLHLPPRLQMVQKLLQNTSLPAHGETLQSFGDGFITTINSKAAAATPFESCSVSPATSCYVSGELDAEDYYFECSTELVQSQPKKSWSKKLKFIGQSSLSLKLKASKAYFKSLFAKSGCSDEKCRVPRVKECSNGRLKPGKKSPSGQIQRERIAAADNYAATTMKSLDGEKMKEEDWCHRRSFSCAMKWHSSTKSSSSVSSSCSSSNSSSFSSANSNGLHGPPPMLKRSSSVNSEMENSIQGAIAYCKKSQQLVSARKSVSDVGFCSLTASRIADDCEKEEKPGLCRG